MLFLSCIPRTVFKKDRIEIDYFDKFKCLHLSWEGRVERDDYFQAQAEMLKLTKKYNIEYWVFDARDEDCLHLYDPEWTVNFYCREVPKHSVKKIARIASGHFHNETKLSDFISKMLKDNNIQYEFRYLPDTNQALAWFLDCGESDNF